jgi:zinc protease
MKRARAFGLCVLAAALLIPAGQGRAQTVTRQTTPAGLAFRYVHMPGEQSQALYFAWRDGTAVAVPGKEAVPALATALIMEGPRGSSRSAMVEDLRDLRATLNLSATANLTQGHLIAPPEKFAEAARLFARTLGEPALVPERLADLVRSRAMAGRQVESNAEALAQRLLARLLIADGPHRRYTGGEPTMLGSVTVDDIERWRKNILVRSGLLIVGAGPMDPGAAAREIDRLFANLPPGEEPSAPPPPVLRAPGKLVVLERPVVQTVIAAGGPTSGAVTPDFARLQLAVAALGGGTSARLWRAVRDKLGATYSIRASLQAIDLNTRTLFVRTAVANDKAKDALAAIRAEYGGFLANGVTDAELEALKAGFVQSHRERLRRASTLAADLIVPALRDFPDDYLAGYEQRLRGYSRAAIEADMRVQLPKPPLTTVVIAPSAEGFAAHCVIQSPADLARCD